MKQITQTTSIKSPHNRLIQYVQDRPGHDKRYGIDNRKINTELDWRPKSNFGHAMSITVNWYLENIDWCKRRNILAFNNSVD